MNRSVVAVAAGIFAATSQCAAEVRHLTLSEAVHLAIIPVRVEVASAHLKLQQQQEIVLD